MEPFISIITVSLNAAATIEDTISSVAHQRTNFGIEHICVDGGSKDATRSIIDRWMARGTVPMQSVYETDNGIFDAMNKGLKVARGEYVLFLNADDFLVSPHTLAKVTQDLAPGAGQNPDLILGNASMGVLGRRGIWRHRRVPSLICRFRGWGLYPVHQGQFTKRRLLELIGGFDTGSKVASDLILYYDMERKMRPTVRIVSDDVAFMRAGGAANAGLKSMYNGTVDIYRHLVRQHYFARAAIMVLVKTLQSVSEIRFGRCPNDRWFSSNPSRMPEITDA